MGSLLKNLVFFVLAIVALLVVAGIALIFLFDPNDYRDQIAAQVEQQTVRGDGEQRVEKQRPFQAALQRLRSFGWDEAENRDYEDPAWLLRYFGWRALRVFDRLWGVVKGVLMILGLRKL